MLLNLGVIAARALDAFLIVIADGHRECEVLATFLAKIFVERHRGSPGEFLDCRGSYYNSADNRFQPARLVVENPSGPP